MKRRIFLIIFALAALPLLGAPQIVNHSPTAAPTPPLVCVWLPFLCF